VSGEVEFTVSGNDAFRIFIGGEKVAEMWENEYGGERTYTLNAEAGKTYPVKIEYMQRTGSADLNVSIGQRKAVDAKATASKAAEADVIIFVGGISPRLEGEELPVKIDGFKKGDRTEIGIPKVQREMVKALKETGKPVIYVLCTGSAIALDWENANLDAVLNAWYGGQEGGTAVADVLFGDYNPSGKLPVTFYASTDQLPDFEDYSMKGRTYRYMTQKPLYPFGYGLSYTSFEISNPQLSKSSINKDESVSLTLDIKNTGATDGDEIVQVYIKNPEDKNGPLKSLKGYKRVAVKSGNTEKVTIVLDADAFKTFDDKTQTMETVSGKHQILYGTSSDDKDLKALDITIL
jgi:beta-glucosidase